MIALIAYPNKKPPYGAALQIKIGADGTQCSATHRPLSSAGSPERGSGGASAEEVISSPSWTSTARPRPRRTRTAVALTYERLYERSRRQCLARARRPC